MLVLFIPIIITSKKILVDWLNVCCASPKTLKACNHLL